MSRIGNKIITIPAGVTVTVNGNDVTVKGPKGELSRTFRPEVSVNVNENTVVVTRINDEKVSKQLHGTTRALLAGMVEGVEKGKVKLGSTAILTGFGAGMTWGGAIVRLREGIC